VRANRSAPVSVRNSYSYGSRRVRRGQGGLRLDGDQRRKIVAVSLLGSDLVSGFAAISLADNVFGLGAANNESGTPVIEAAFTALPFLIGFFWMFGLYNGYGPCPVERFRIRVLGMLVYMGAFIVTRGEPIRFDLWLAAVGQGGLVFLFGFYAEALTRSALVSAGLWGAVTVFVGNGPDIEQAYGLFSSTADLGLRPVGTLKTGRSAPDAEIRVSVPVLGFVRDLPRIESPEIECVVATSYEDCARISNATRFAARPPRVLLLVSDGRPGNALFGPRTINLNVGQNAHTRHNRLIKRTIDLLVGIPSFLIALPLIGVLALAIKFSDPGPAFYSQTRVGFKKRPFRVAKLRSMYCDAEERLEHHLRNDATAKVEWDRFFKLTHDPRVLPYIGNIIRCLSLDELPQLWNVIRGDMSLIGPRPFPIYHTERFDPEFQTLRADVPPGLTGLWQVSSRSNGDLDTQKNQDLYYVHNWSIWLDLYILLKTVSAVIGAWGAR
jgi:Undecaprenyl-phosphate galactose phosphotransferase WbaP